MEPDYEVQLRNTIRTVLTALHQEQATAADRIGISHSSFNRKMVGKAHWSLKEVARLADWWGCSIPDLLQGEPHALNAIMKSPRQRDRSSSAA